jgi:ribose transport system ATP-binding protein
MACHATGIHKAFSGVAALSDVDLTVGDGEIHALLGPNGSGKSTMARILSGVYQPDAGRIRIGDVETDSIGSPKVGADMGVRIVHQEAPLIDTVSIAECMALFGSYPGSSTKISWSRVRRDARERLADLGAEIDVDAMAGTLSPATRAVVGLAIALGGESNARPELLILDEATASIPEDSAHHFLDRAKALAEGGVPTLMVTHRLPEVFKYADRVTVLVSGTVRYSGPVGEATEDQLIEVMVGEPAEKVVGHEAPRPTRRHTAAPTAAATGDAGGDTIEISGLRTATLKGIDLTIAPGEMVGVVGGPESGVEEITGALGGDDGAVRGKVVVDGVSRRLPRTPREAIELGIALVPRDRLHSGGVGSLSAAENLLLPDSRRYWHRRASARAAVARIYDDFDVQPPRSDVLFRALSGGNQQKLVIGKWLLRSPRLLLLDDPTSGVDPNARRKIFEVLEQEIQRGLSVLLLSTEPEQIVERCSRVIAIDSGEVAGEYRGTEISNSTIAGWAAA